MNGYAIPEVKSAKKVNPGEVLLVASRENHLNVVYAPCEETANKALAAKATMMAERGIAVHLCGTCLNNRHQ